MASGPWGSTRSLSRFNFSLCERGEGNKEIRSRMDGGKFAADELLDLRELVRLRLRRKTDRSSRSRPRVPCGRCGERSPADPSAGSSSPRGSPPRCAVRGPPRPSPRGSQLAVPERLQRLHPLFLRHVAGQESAADRRAAARRSFRNCVSSRRLANTITRFQLESA